MKTVLSVLIFWLVCCQCYTHDGFSFKLDAGKRRCFDEDFASPTTVYLEYKALSGNVLEVNCDITGPDGNVVANLIASREESATSHVFTATKDGPYTFCFDASQARETTKTHVKILSEKSAKPAADDGQDQKLSETIESLSNVCKSLNNDFSRLHNNNKVTEKVLTSTQSNVFWWSLGEMLGIVLVNGAFCLYLKSVCETKRTV